MKEQMTYKNNNHGQCLSSEAWSLFPWHCKVSDFYTTTAVKASFITSSYVIFIPLISIFFFKAKFERLTVSGLAGAMVGMMIFL